MEFIREIEELIDEHYKGAAHGVKRSTVARAVRAQAAQSGADFQGVQLTYFNNFTGKARGGGSKELEAGQCLMSDGTKIASAHASLALECAMNAKTSKGTVQEAHLMGEAGRKMIHCLVTRNFAGGSWRTSKLVPLIDGITPEVVRVMQKGFGFFERCETSNTRDLSSSQDPDAILFRTARIAVDRMRILDTCALDTGFRDRLVFWLEELQGIQACNVPFSMVEAELGGLLAAAQNQRQAELSFGVEVGASDVSNSLSFRVTKEITAGEQRLLGCSRQQFKHEQAMMARMFEEACKNGMVNPGSPHIRDGHQGQDQRHRQEQNRRKADQHRERQAQANANRIWGRPLTVVKKEQQLDKARTPPAGGGGRNGPFERVPQEKWAKAFKDEADGDKPLCWFHNNRPGGCTGGYGGVCKWSHAHRPKAYGGKAWADLASDDQSKIEALVEKA